MHTHHSHREIHANIQTSKQAKPFNEPSTMLVKYSIALFLITLILAAGGWLFAYVWHWQNRPHLLEVYCFSVDGNLATFIRTPLGQTILVDGGKTDTIIRDLTSVMPFYERTIDTLILSSDDDAHATGLVSVLERYHVGRVYEMDSIPATDTLATTSVASSSAYTAFEKIIADRNIIQKKVSRGDSISIGELSANVVFPEVNSIDSDFKYSKTNMPTMAFEMTYASTTLFFGGDITKTEQKYIAAGMATSSVSDLESTSRPVSGLASGNASSPSTVLILPRGENAGIVDEGFFDKVSPNFFVVIKKPRSAGATNATPKPPKVIATTTKTGKPKKPPKPPKPPFDVSNLAGETISITNLMTDGDVEYISNGSTFMLKKL